MTHAERAVRFNEAQVLAEVVLAHMNLGVYETATSFAEQDRQIAENKELLKRLIAKVRALGKDFSGTIQYTTEFASNIR